MTPYYYRAPDDLVHEAEHDNEGLMWCEKLNIANLVWMSSEFVKVRPPVTCLACIATKILLEPT